MLKSAIALLTFILIFNNSFAVTQTQYEDYKNASLVIGKWLTKSTSQNDFLSASPIAIRRPGIKFMIAEQPDTQYASDYGFSQMRSPLDNAVKAAYQTIGADTTTLPSYLELNRFHIGLGLGNEDDIMASYITTQDMTLRGFGLGYKKVLYKLGPIFFSYRLQYSQTTRDNFFSQQNISNDFSMSIYLLFFDFYGGARHSAGYINFDSTDPALALPEIKYISKTNEIEYFYGVTATLSTKMRLTVQANKVNDDYSIGAKLSFHFNSLTPEFKNLFTDPRYLKR